jgi:hypothetical protein
MRSVQSDTNFRIWAIGMMVAILLLVSHLVVSRPLGAKYRQKLQSLRPEQIRTLRLQTDARVGNEYVTRERVLSGKDVSRFLALLSESKTCASNHRSGGWVCLVDIDTTTDIPRFSFIVRSTGRHGVQFDLKPSGWAYGGTLRNDALGPFVEALFHNSQ